MGIHIFISFCSPQNVSLKVLSVKYRNVQILSNLSKERAKNGHEILRNTISD